MSWHWRALGFRRHIGRERRARSLRGRNSDAYGARARRTRLTAGHHERAYRSPIDASGSFRTADSARSPSRRRHRHWQRGVGVRNLWRTLARTAMENSATRRWRRPPGLRAARLAISSDILQKSTLRLFRGELDDRGAITSASSSQINRHRGGQRTATAVGRLLGVPLGAPP